MSSDPSEDEIVMVPVPKGRLQEVYGLLARQPRDSVPSPEEPLYAPGTAEAKVAWYSKVRVRQLKKELPRYPGADAVVRLAAQAALNGAETISIRDAQKSSGLNQQTVAAQLGAMTKLCKKLFKSDEWPIIWKWALGGEQCMYYLMPKEIAELWLSDE